MAQHLVPIPAGMELGELPSTSSWSVWHFVVADCPCSSLLEEELLKSGAQDDLVEKVVRIGGNQSESELWNGRGFEFVAVTSDRAEQEYGVQGGPWLMVARPDGSVLYSGGYSERLPNRADDFLHRMIVERLISGEEVKLRPAFGCASATALKSRIDPLGLK